MAYDKEKHHRHSIRLPGYDYSQIGMYFVTICAHERQCSFGRIMDGVIQMNATGRMIWETWDNLPRHYPHMEPDAFMVMPNHVHAIILLTDAVGAGLKPAPTAIRYSLSEIVRGFKTFSARQINQSRGTLGVPVWQRGYYEHVIRNEHEWSRVRDYIETNPARWAEDRENPEKRASQKRSVKPGWRV
ncbi:MAG TPA: transposase [Candidatus Brocadiia bacterium]|nr:transposase [Candidatus Brocadiia bacterium]